MSKTPNIDSNLWYHMYVTSGPGQALIGLNPGKDGPSAAVYFNPTKLTAPTNRWQIFQLNSTTYALRCQSGGPDMWLGVKIGDSGEDAPYLARGDVSDNSAFWTIGSWGDDFWYLSNAANGTSRLNKKGTGLVEMSENITAPQSGERWKFDAIDSINDPQYSRVNLLGAVIATSTTSSGTLSSSTSSPTTSFTPLPPTGLSTGAKAGVGAAISIGALIALVVLGLYFWRKRKQGHASVKPKYEPAGTGYNATTSYEPVPPPVPPRAKYEMYSDHDVAKYELQSISTVAEVPGSERPVELAGHAVQR
ncbi:hypothetical protein T440DRAFT_466811 [Plenodomus tracheiphilus IPT5]|uniref:Uncharacterized protein n=1 Tax=Plenodomus tracheiphilus IPT5 TaxID=1408161 RepID=A0A6A7BER2_9PLEO|nr:hypothetical protein T440DRAFT_466811 [Plenodomus tracheiphilus IPT5]